MIITKPYLALHPLPMELLFIQVKNLQASNSLTIFRCSIAVVRFSHKKTDADDWNPTIRIYWQTFHQIDNLTPPADYFLNSQAKKLTTTFNTLILNTLTELFHKNR